MGPTDFVVGRAPECDLVLDDTLVSRKHAAFRVDGDAVEVRDLGSRNGVLLNNKRIAGSARMQHGDRAMIGSRELVLRDVDRTRPVQGGTAELMQCSGCGSFVQSLAEACTECGAKLSKLREPQLSDPPQAVERDISARPVGSLSVVAKLADKAFGLGRNEEAERILSAPLQSMLTRATTHSTAEQETLETAARCALRLGEALTKPTWLDYAFDLYAAYGALMSADIVEAVYQSVDKVRHTNARALRAYLARMRSSQRSLSPSERFLLQRLDGLERRMVS